MTARFQQILTGYRYWKLAGYSKSTFFSFLWLTNNDQF